MDWPRSPLASSLWSGVTSTTGKRSKRLVTFITGEILVYIAAAVQIFGGIAIQWPRTARVGAILLGSIYLIFALLWVRIVTEPRVRAAIASGVRRYLQQSTSDADRPLRLLMRDLILFSRIPNVWSPTLPRPKSE